MLGIEADVNATPGRQDWYYDYWAAEGGGFAEQLYAASIRGRVGILVDDNALVYTTAGVVLTEYYVANDCLACAEWGSTEYVKGMRTSWVAGAGMEYAISPNLHVKGEYLYSPFDKLELSYSDGDAFGVFRSTLINQVVRVGASYNF